MKTKIAGVFLAFMCLAMVTGSFAATPNTFPQIDTKKP